METLGLYLLLWAVAILWFGYEPGTGTGCLGLMFIIVTPAFMLAMCT